jgi:hypothetical protein
MEQMLVTWFSSHGLSRTEVRWQETFGLDSDMSLMAQVIKERRIYSKIYYSKKIKYFSFIFWYVPISFP